MNRHEKIVKALNDIAPNTEWTITGDDLDNLVWFSESPRPTNEALEAAIANPLPISEPTVAEKLASVGLSLEELRSALGGN
jgi:hypothetical protein